MGARCGGRRAASACSARSASRGFDARASVRALNRLCIENSAFEADGEFLATVFFGIVDADRRTMQYVSAGHEAAYVVEHLFDDNSVAFSIADISGKGARAAVHAALIKYGLRAFSSHGLAPERALRSPDRLYLENNNFEQNESFATVFFGLVDPKRKVMAYASAGHEPVIIVHPDRTVEVLAPTAPLIGVFDDQHHLFTQDVVTLSAGTLFVATTDGVTESRNSKGEMFAMDRFIAIVKNNFDCELKQLIASV
ncbi:MAG TPA: PP2C family protein-serine/threonine phosphatase, partial [Candidatus Elarobacter sp.]